MDKIQWSKIGAELGALIDNLTKKEQTTLEQVPGTASFLSVEELQGLRAKINGCANACMKHAAELMDLQARMKRTESNTSRPDLADLMTQVRDISTVLDNSRVATNERISKLEHSGTRGRDEDFLDNLLDRTEKLESYFKLLQGRMNILAPPALDKKRANKKFGSFAKKVKKS